MIPTLDFSMRINPAWAKDKSLNKFKYAFFKKSMADPRMVKTRSGVDWNCSRSSMSQEIIRRMLNCDSETTQEERNTIIENFINKLRNIGYTQDQTE